MRVLTITLILSLGAAATFSEEGGPDYAYCPEDPEVQALIEDTIDNIFKYLGDEDHPIKYIHIDHGHIKRMHTCAKCYDASGTSVGGKDVTPCGKLLADDVDRYYDAITAAAVEHQGGLVPDMFIWADCFSWTSNAIAFGPTGFDFLDRRNKYRNQYGYPPDEEIDVNDIAVDSCRWLLQDHPKLVMMPWEYSINMLNVDGGEDVVTRWLMSDLAEEFVEGNPAADDYHWWDHVGGLPYDEYPQYRLAGCPTGFPERFIEYGRSSECKNTEYYEGRGGVYVGLQLLKEMPGDDVVITKSTPAGVANSEEPILKTGQCIEGSLWHHVPDHFDEWPEHLGAQEDWYYAENNFKKLKKNYDPENPDLGSFNGGYIYKDGYSEDDIDYARFRVHFDSYPYDQPGGTDVGFGFGAGGKVWCDDAEFRGSTTDWATEFEVDNFNDAYFRYEGAGGKAFTHWDLTKTGEGSLDQIKEYYDTAVYRFVNTAEGTSSCRYDRRKALSDEFYHSAVETDVADFGINYNFNTTQFRVGVRLRAKYIDTYRLGNVWQWQYILDKYDYLKPDADRETALGIVTYNPSRFVFYGEPGTFAFRQGCHRYLNGRAADAAVAEWCWSLNKPRVWDKPVSMADEGIYDTPKLENLWYCPYYIHQREKTWFEKK
jgi:hypothetical protein